MVVGLMVVLPHVSIVIEGAAAGWSVDSMMLVGAIAVVVALALLIRG
jgi:hypothetical protein